MTRIARLRLCLAIVAGLALLPNTAGASSVIYEDASGNVINGVTSITLAQFTSGYHIVINNGFDTKDFQGVAGSYSSEGINGGTAANANLITVSGDAGGGLDPGPGLLYHTVLQWTVGANQGQDTVFQYTVTVVGPSAYLLHDDSLTLGAATVGSNGGAINIIESALNPAPPNNNIADNQVLLINTAGVTTGATTDQVFYSPQTSVLIKKDIGLQGGDSTDGNAGVTSFTDMQQRFSQTAVPEPSSIAVAGLGALGMIGYGLRRRKARGA
jgi:hypothetical protein